ncbi:hypothetical protein [Kribbella deserti]|uniref:Uncharacterized protein n=1 Tax=Kribbella deserti TaxID=1926257 RepID=A0ABV6QEI3_9ACTN
MSLQDFAARLARTEIPWWLARTMSAVLALHTIVCGLDYINTPTGAIWLPSLTIVEEIATLRAWGIVFLVAGITLAIGLIARLHLIVWVGHLLGAGLFFAFTIASAQAVWMYFHSPAVDTQGWILRAVTQSLLGLTGHLILLYIRKGPVPRKAVER